MAYHRFLPYCIPAGCSAECCRICGEGSDPGIVSITSEDDFVLLTENCKTESFSTGKTFRLDADLDLSNYENLFLPVMDGTFDGNGHQIIGVTLSEEMSDYGLFRYVTEKWSG